MNPRMIIFGVIALAMAGGTALMVKGWMSAQQKKFKTVAAPKAPTNVILVAKQDLPTGTFLKREHMAWQAWPGNKIQKAYIKKGLRKDSDFVGAVVRTSIVVGEPITEGRIAKKGNKGFMAAVLTPGMRAVSLRISASGGVSGFVFPGDRVDIILTHIVKPESSGKSKKKVAASKLAETILENVRILAVDQTPEDRSNKAKRRKAVTVEVTPKQAEFVTVAQVLGKLSLSLRSLTREEMEGGFVEKKLDPNLPERFEPATRGLTHTADAEVSRLLEGVGRGGAKVVIVRGIETEEMRVSK